MPKGAMRLEMTEPGPRPTFVTMSRQDVRGLSDRQKDALRRAARAQSLKKKGYTIREIMAELGRSKRMIAYYLRVDLNASIMQALDERRDIGATDIAPPTIEIKEDLDAVTFCEDPAYLNFKLNPMQKLILKAFYSLELSDEELAILEDLVKRGKTTWKPEEKYRELVVVAGMKGGKTILASVIACYEEFSLYRLGDPVKAYGFAEGEKIFIINVATSGDQAEDTIYARTLARIQNSPFYDLRPYEEIGKTVNFKDDGVKIRCGHSNSASIVGKTSKLVLFDELARFKDKGGKNSAEAVYTALTRSVEPFEQDGKIVSISSPIWEKDKIMSLYGLSSEIPNMLGFKLATWEMNPRLPKKSFQWEFKKNPEAAQRDFGADPSKPKERYYRVPSKIKETFERMKGNPSPVKKDGTLVSKKEFHGNLEFDYYLHGDPAAFNNAFGLAMGHRLGDYVYLDFVYGFEAGEGEVDVNEIKNIILELLNRGFRIKKATFDTWAAVSVWQALQARGVQPANLYVLKEQHDELKQAIYGDHLMGYPHGKLRDEIKELILLKGMKVDHPSGGSKDLADAVAAVTWHCMQEETVELASGSKDPEPEEFVFGRRRLWR